ncbi:MAG: MFS transporter, partial [Vicinamibacterales bacterium]
MTDRIHETIDTGPMSRFQVVAVLICITLNMLDGFDVLVMAFTASDVQKEWALSGAQLGILLSSGLFGMAAGSMFLAPFADRFGRRALILTCLVLITAGMLMSAAATGPRILGALRVLTGIGIGGMLASLNVITGEYSSNRWRSAAISMQATGYPIGATIGGIIAAWLIVRFGWRSIFLFGGVMSALMIPLVLTRLPESLDFLLARRPQGALDKLNHLLTKMEREPVTELPRIEDVPKAHAKLADLFKGGWAGSTLLIWTSFFMVMLGFYFVLSWTPRLLVAAGMSTQQGITGGVLLNIGGIIGGSVFAWLSVKGSLKNLASLSMFLTVIALIAYGYYSGVLGLAFVLALMSGIFIFASMVSLYAITPVLYPAAVRTTGMGWAIGIGRLGAILAPLLAGVLVDSGWQAAHL